MNERSSIALQCDARRASARAGRSSCEFGVLSRKKLKPKRKRQGCPARAPPHVVAPARELDTAPRTPTSPNMAASATLLPPLYMGRTRPAAVASTSRVAGWTPVAARAHRARLGVLRRVSALRGETIWKVWPQGNGTPGVSYAFRLRIMIAPSPLLPQCAATALWTASRSPRGRRQSSGSAKA